MSDKLFVNGVLRETSLVEQEALSRGFAFGFGVFETIKFLDGKPCFFAEHLDRLRRAAKEAALRIDIDEAELRDQVAILIASGNAREGVFKIVISDGVDRPLIAVFQRPPSPLPPEQGVRLRLSEVVKASQAFTSRHKTLNYMESVLELESAKAAGFGECVFVNERGELTECAVANLFFVAGGVLKTPAVECGLLDGIVRAKILELAKSRKIPIEVGRFFAPDLLEADEVFITSSGLGPRPVASFEDRQGRRASYKSGLLHDLRQRFMDTERQSL